MAVDSAPIIYFVEQVEPYLSTVSPFFAALVESRNRAITSILTLMEVSVRPLTLGMMGLVESHEQLISRRMDVFDVDRGVARRAAELRARYRFRPMDSLQLATALEYGAEWFLTNDSALTRCDDIRVVLVTS